MANDKTDSPWSIYRKRAFGAVMRGNCIPDVLMRRLIGLRRQDKFLFDKLIKFYPLAASKTTAHDSESGAVVKPVLFTGEVGAWCAPTSHT